MRGPRGPPVEGMTGERGPMRTALHLKKRKSDMNKCEVYEIIHRELDRGGDHHGLDVRYMPVAGHPELLAVLRWGDEEAPGRVYICGVMEVYSFLVTLSHTPDHDVFWQRVERIADQVDLRLLAEVDLPERPARIRSQIQRMTAAIEERRQHVTALEALWQGRDAHPDADV
jgi:hypothetical protein